MNDFTSFKVLSAYPWSWVDHTHLGASNEIHAFKNNIYFKIFCILKIGFFQQ